MSMDYEGQLKLQAFLDGELSEAQAQEVSGWLVRDPEAAALLGELRNTRQAMVGQEMGIALPESREFFWSKVRREIERAPAPEAGSAFPWASIVRRFLAPASALAVLGVALLLTFRPGDGLPAETALADPGAFTYHDYSAGTTLVWLSYPADNEKAPSEPMGSAE